MKSQVISKILAAGIVIMAAIAVMAQTSLNRGIGIQRQPISEDYVVMAWVEAERDSLPDPSLMTHITYAFGEFNENNDSLVIPVPSKLIALNDLKLQNPDLKLILGVGGYKKEGFSEMACDASKRSKFIESCVTAMNQYGLDGFEFDWEFPTTTDGGHTARPDDADNYILLVKELRERIGKTPWISVYSNHSARWLELPAMLPYLTCVDMSGYNLSWPPEHQSNLYPSSKHGEWCITKGLARHLKMGIPPEKIIIGIPFYARGASPFPRYPLCNQLSEYSQNCTMEWDDEAKAPYMADATGNLVCSFDSPKSIAYKCQYVRDNGYKGVFYWHYDADYSDHRLAKAVHNGLMSDN